MLRLVVTVDNAKQLAADFFSASSLDRLDSTDALDLAYVCGTASRPVYYVFNARGGAGYIIISADDCTTPVLGYSLEGRYDASMIPPAMNWMMHGLESEIKAAPSLQRPVPMASAVSWYAVRLKAMRESFSRPRSGVRKPPSTVIYPAMPLLVA